MKTTALNFLNLCALSLIFLFSISFIAHAETKLDDKAIFSIFDQVNGFDIETASLGVVEGHSKDVRKLAAMVLRDHSMVIQMGKNLARQKNIIFTVDQTSQKEHAQKMAGLKKLSGPAFDKAYLAHEAAFHAAAIKAVKEILIPSAKDAKLQGLLKAVLPGFEHHLMETRRIAKKLGYQ